MPVHVAEPPEGEGRRKEDFKSDRRGEEKVRDALNDSCHSEEHGHQLRNETRW